MLWLIHIVLIVLMVLVMKYLRYQAGQASQRKDKKLEPDSIKDKCRSESTRKKLKASASKMATAAYDSVYDMIIGSAQDSPRDAIGAVARCFAVAMVVTFIAYLRVPIILVRVGRALCIPLSMYGSLVKWEGHQPSVDALNLRHPDQKLRRWKEIFLHAKTNRYGKERRCFPRWFFYIVGFIYFIFQYVNIFLCIMTETFLGPLVNVNTCCIRSYSRFSLRDALSQHMLWSFYGRSEPLGTNEFMEHVVRAKHHVSKVKYAGVMVTYASMPRDVGLRKVCSYFGWTAAWCLASMTYAQITAWGPSTGPVSDQSMDLLFSAYTVVGVAIYFLTLFAPRRTTDVNIKQWGARKEEPPPSRPPPTTKDGDVVNPDDVAMTVPQEVPQETQAPDPVRTQKEAAPSDKLVKHSEVMNPLFEGPTVLDQSYQKHMPLQAPSRPHPRWAKIARD